MSQDNPPPTTPGGLLALLGPFASLLLGVLLPAELEPGPSLGERVKAAAAVGALLLALFSACLVACGFALALIVAAAVGVRS